MQCTLPHPAPPCTTAAHDIVYDIEAKRRREELAEQQPQVHILGEILGGTGFTGAVCCKWAVEAGTPQGENLWVLVEGDEAGQTQTDYPVQGTDVAVWSHPLDVHYNAGTLSVRELRPRAGTPALDRRAPLSCTGLAAHAAVCVALGRRRQAGAAGVWRVARALHTGQLRSELPHLAPRRHAVPGDGSGLRGGRAAPQEHQRPVHRPAAPQEHCDGVLWHGA